MRCAAWEARAAGEGWNRGGHGQTPCASTPEAAPCGGATLEMAAAGEARGPAGRAARSSGPAGVVAAERGREC